MGDVRCNKHIVALNLKFGFRVLTIWLCQHAKSSSPCFVCEIFSLTAYAYGEIAIF